MDWKNAEVSQAGNNREKMDDMKTVSNRILLQSTPSV